MAPPTSALTRRPSRSSEERITAGAGNEATRCIGAGARGTEDLRLFVTLWWETQWSIKLYVHSNILTPTGSTWKIFTPETAAGKISPSAVKDALATICSEAKDSPLLKRLSGPATIGRAGCFTLYVHQSILDYDRDCRLDLEGFRALRVWNANSSQPLLNLRVGDSTRRVVGVDNTGLAVLRALPETKRDGLVYDNRARLLYRLCQDSTGRKALHQLGAPGEMAVTGRPDNRGFQIKDVAVSRETLVGWERNKGSLPTGFADMLKQQQAILLDSRHLDPEEFTVPDKGMSPLGSALGKLQSELGINLIERLSNATNDELPLRLRGLLVYSSFVIDREFPGLDAHAFHRILPYVRQLRNRRSDPGRTGEGPVVRVIIGHATEKALQDLIARAGRQEFVDEHIILGLCNTDPRRIQAFCKAAYEKGCLSVTIPSGAVNVPVVTLTAELLARNPDLHAGRTPKQAWHVAQGQVFAILTHVKNELTKINNGPESDHQKRRKMATKARELFGAHFDPAAVEMFQDVRSTPGQLDNAILPNIESAINEAERFRMMGTWRQTVRRPSGRNEAVSIAA